jgi:hypothetical protein
VGDGGEVGVWVAADGELKGYDTRETRRVLLSRERSTRSLE